LNSRGVDGRPVLLVHGYLAFPHLLLPMKRALRRHGVDAYLAKLSFLCLGDVRKLARQVGDNVERICEETGSDRVDLVGVSLGGFAALHYLRELGGAERVGAFAAVASPFQGTWFALLGVAALGAVSRGAWQCLPTSDWVREMTEGGAPLVPMTSIALAYDPVAPAVRCHLEGARFVEIQGLPHPLVHQSIGFDPRVVRAVVTALAPGSSRKDSGARS